MATMLPSGSADPEVVASTVSGPSPVLGATVSTAIGGRLGDEISTLEVEVAEAPVLLVALALTKYVPGALYV